MKTKKQLRSEVITEKGRDNSFWHTFKGKEQKFYCQTFPFSPNTSYIEHEMGNHDIMYQVNTKEDFVNFLYENQNIINK